MSEGQVRYVKETEIANIRKVFNNLKIQPKLAFIIVNKRINSRFYAKKGADYGNPPAGTVIDECVTLPERYDFFVIPQNVRQGTVNPTSYNVIEVRISCTLNGLFNLAVYMSNDPFLTGHDWPETGSDAAPHLHDVPSVLQLVRNHNN